MKRETALNLFRQTEALLDGHFLLTSGLHSPQYFQCAKVLQYPEYCKTLCQDIANHYQAQDIDVIISPAIGGIVVGQQVAMELNCRAIFAERVDGQMTLRRGFAIHPGENVLAVEDVVTTGGSIKQIITIAKEAQANVPGAGFIVDRSAGQIELGVPHYAIFEMDVKTYAPENCPLCKKGLPLEKPGSRKIKQNS